MLIKKMSDTKWCNLKLYEGYLMDCDAICPHVFFFLCFEQQNCAWKCLPYVKKDKTRLNFGSSYECKVYKQRYLKKREVKNTPEYTDVNEKMSDINGVGDGFMEDT